MKSFLSERKLTLKQELFRRLTNWKTNEYFDTDTYAFIEYNRRKWKNQCRGREKDGVILVGLFDWPPLICAFSITSNLLAKKFDARIAAYHLRTSVPGKSASLYESFGASLELTLEAASAYEKDAQEFAREIFSKIEIAEDIYKICIEDIPVGDLIHDTFLRHEYLTEADPANPKLEDYIRLAYLTHRACKDYLEKNDVKAILLNDPGFIDATLLHRMAIQRDIPAFLLSYSPFVLWKMDTTFAEGDRRDFRNWPIKIFSYRNLPSRFKSLPVKEQEKGLQLAKTELETLFSGKRDFVLMNAERPVYASPSGARVLADTSTPKIAVLLHDMIDCPNSYRRMLFTDFTAWIRHLLSKAAETPFEWYVKPHPHRHNDKRHTQVNDALLEKLKKEYPKARFIDSKTSNLQILEEGICALFTVHGTAGPEFAYHGVPVVTAGDNPYFEYDFVLHAQSIQEYDEYIRTADRLAVKPTRRAIEEYHFMRSIQPYSAQPRKVSTIPEEWLGDPKRFTLEQSPETYRHFVQSDDTIRDQHIMECIEFALNT